MTGMKQIPTSHVCYTDKSELKEFLVDKMLSHICSTDEDESKAIIVDECSTEEDESECVHKNINKQKNEKNEAKYEEYSVTDEVPSYFNIFKGGRNILNRLDLTYERSWMTTQEEEYYRDLLETMNEHNDRTNTPLSKEKLRQQINTILAETE